MPSSVVTSEDGGPRDPRRCAVRPRSARRGGAPPTPARPSSDGTRRRSRAGRAERPFESTPEATAPSRGRRRDPATRCSVGRCQAAHAAARVARRARPRACRSAGIRRQRRHRRGSAAIELVVEIQARGAVELEQAGRVRALRCRAPGCPLTPASRRADRSRLEHANSRPAARQLARHRTADDPCPNYEDVRIRHQAIIRRSACAVQRSTCSARCSEVQRASRARCAAAPLPAPCDAAP